MTTEPQPRLSDDALRLLVAMARKLATTSLIAQQGHCDEPQAGDLVVETTGFRIDPDAIGWLVGHGEAPYHEDDPLDGSVPMREVWDVRPLSGRAQEGKDFQRWENSTFVKLPDSIAEIAREMHCAPA